MSKNCEIINIQCDNNDRNNGNIIIEVSEIGTETDQIKFENSDSIEIQDIVDSPEIINIAKIKTDNNLVNSSGNIDDSDTVVFCETLYRSDVSNGFNNVQIEKSDDHFLTLVESSPTEVNIIEDIPNEVLVYTCRPENMNPLEMYPCRSCGMVTGCIFCLKSHYESIHLNLGLIQYKCDQTSYLKNYTEICHKCYLVCESKQEMFEHRKIHFVSCDVCDMSFDSALFLSNHCKTSHEKFEVIISCDLCEQWFKHLQDLSNHYQNYHGMILCIVCYKRFSNTTELIEHHKTHKIVLTDVKPILPYACSKCNQAFARITDLSCHLVRDHPNRKAGYGTIAQRSTSLKAKYRKKNIHFNDCGGLSKDGLIDLDYGSISTKTKRSKRIINEDMGR